MRAVKGKQIRGAKTGKSVATPPVTPEIDGIKIWCAFRELVHTENLIPNPRNPNTHPDNQIALLAKIIKGNGWRAPITVSKRSGFVVRGHGRYRAAQALGLSAVPVDYQDYESEAAEWADLIADNRIAELAEMDENLLKDLLSELVREEIDMELTGFDSNTLAEMIAINSAKEKSSASGGNEKYEPRYAVIIDCDNEETQTKLLERFLDEGLSCRALML